MTQKIDFGFACMQKPANHCNILLEESFMELHALAKIKIKIIKIAKLLLVAALDGVITGGDCG